MPGKSAKKSKRSYKTTTKKRAPKKSSRKSMIFEAVRDEVEKKNADVETGVTVPLTSSFATPALVNGIAQSTTPGGHIGRRATMKSLQLRYTAAPSNNVSQVRVLLVYDKQTNAATPTATDIVQSNVFTSPLNLQNKDRFVVLMDEVSAIMPSTTQNVSGSRYMKMNLPITFNGSTAATVAAIQTGAIWLLVANNSDPAIGTTSNFYYYTRVRFTDE